MSIDNNQEIDEIEETEEVEETNKEEPLLKDMVERLKKQAKIPDEKLEGKTLREQYEVLSFYIDNKPQLTKKKGNKPVVPVVTQVGGTEKDYKINYKTSDSIGWSIDLINVLNKRK